MSRINHTQFAAQIHNGAKHRSGQQSGQYNALSFAVLSAMAASRPLYSAISRAMVAALQNAEGFDGSHPCTNDSPARISDENIRTTYRIKLSALLLGDAQLPIESQCARFFPLPCMQEKTSSFRKENEDAVYHGVSIKLQSLALDDGSAAENRETFAAENRADRF
jgi:hypothetical protein